MENMKINQLPSRTWNWLKMNETAVSGISVSGAHEGNLEIPDGITKTVCPAGLPDRFKDIAGGMGSDMDMLVKESAAGAVLLSADSDVSGEPARIRFSYGASEHSLNTFGILAKEGKKITGRTMELFLSKTGDDMENIRMELEKLISYTVGRDVVTAADIRAVCTTQTTNKIFDMVRAVTEKNQKRALDLYYDLLTLREPPMRILFLLAKQFRQICLTKKMSQEGLSQTEIASKLGVPSFVVRNLASCARSYTVEELENAVRDFVDAEEAVKTGTLGDVLSVELLIVKYSSARAVRA